MPRRGTTPQRGYGYHHKLLRRRWQEAIDAGADVRCWRPGCGRPILPGDRWDLGHDDHDRSIYRGPECVGCNRRAGSARANRRRWGKAKGEQTSRRW